MSRMILRRRSMGRGAHYYGNGMCRVNYSSSGSRVQRSPTPPDYSDSERRGQRRKMVTFDREPDEVIQDRYHWKSSRLEMNRKTEPEAAPASTIATPEDKFLIITADHFQKLYYDAIDKRRHLMSKLYLDTGVLVWNGHSMNNAADIQKFYTTLAATTHTIASVDSMFVPKIAVGAQKTVLVSVSGNIFLKTDFNRATKPFTQTFILTHHQDKWKIVSDIFRTQTPIGVTTIC